MALRQAPKRKIDLQQLDDLQKEIFGTRSEEKVLEPNRKQENLKRENKEERKSDAKNLISKTEKPVTEEAITKKAVIEKAQAEKEVTGRTNQDGKGTDSIGIRGLDKSSKNIQERENIKPEDISFGDMETIAGRITYLKAGHGRNTTRPFSIPRTLIIDTTRLKAKFRTIDEQFTQNVIIDYLLRESLMITTPENYKELKTAAFKLIKHPEETSRRSLTVTEEVIYKMSELKAGINMETGKKYSNDEIFSTLLAIGVSALYRGDVLS